jgi:hypothetical protein
MFHATRLFFLRQNADISVFYNALPDAVVLEDSTWVSHRCVARPWMGRTHGGNS